MNKGKKNIFLIGFMGAGKSTIARAIKHAGWGKRCISYGNTADHIRTCKKQYGPSTFKRSYECCIHF